MNRHEADKTFVSVEALKQAMDLIDISICITSPDGVEIWGNKCWEKFYALKREEILGRNVFDLEKEGVYNPSLAKGIIEDGEEKNLIHTNINGRELMSRGKIMCDDEGEMIGIITHAMDITDLIVLEDQLQDARRKLKAFQRKEIIQSNHIIAQDASMEDVIELVDSVANIDDTILLTGESGTGKSSMAKYIHDVSDRYEGPFVSVNCGAIPETLFESELFGYEGGAFTGSSKTGKQGLFEAANKGTLFLDEVGETPLNLQVKLLQALQEKAIYRVGGTKAVPIDVRIIAATNKDLEASVREGTFREDLFYRLNVVPVEIPPLRERPEDILLMISEFLKDANKKYKKKKTLSANTMAALLKYNWPGNVRELENIIKRLVIISKEEEIQPELLPRYIYDKFDLVADTAAKSELSLKEAMDMCEKHILTEAMKKYNSSRKMAKRLGVDQSTIIRKLNKYGLSNREEDI